MKAPCLLKLSPAQIYKTRYVYDRHFAQEYILPGFWHFERIAKGCYPNTEFVRYTYFPSIAEHISDVVIV